MTSPLQVISCVSPMRYATFVGASFALTHNVQLGYSNAMLFMRGPVRFLSLDSISFARPVPIGSVLRLTSYILHTSHNAEYPALIVRFPCGCNCRISQRLPTACWGQGECGGRAHRQGATHERLPVHVVQRIWPSTEENGCSQHVCW